MANTAKWNIRLRHEWLQTPLKKKHMKRNKKVRVGLHDAEARRSGGSANSSPPPSEKAAG